MISFTVSGKNMDLYDLKKKSRLAREKSFILLHINKLTVKLY